MTLLPSNITPLCKFKLRLDSYISFYIYESDFAKEFDRVYKAYPVLDKGVLSILDGRILGAYVNTQDLDKTKWFLNFEGTSKCRDYFAYYRT